MPPTHVILISADQMRGDAMGCINPRIITPNLDRLARAGTLFTRAYCANSVCTPSRAAIFTGRYPQCIGAWNIGVSLNEDELTLCDHLKPAGYRCVANGKMHFRPQLRPGPWNEFVSETPSIRQRGRKRDGTYFGFDETHITEDDKVGEYLDWLKERAPQWADNLSGDPRDGTLHELGSVLPPEFHQTNWVADRSVETILSHDDSCPLFMWTSFVDPHHPFDAPRDYVRQYASIPIDAPVARPGEHDPRPQHLRFQGERGYWPGGAEPHSHSPTEIEHIIRNYRAMITFIDEQIGRIITALAQRQMLEQTLIIFTSDHGELLGDHGLLMKGPWHYESLIRVPMIITGPGVAAGQTAANLFEQTDILPTILDLIGKQIPHGIQGKSQAPTLRGQSPPIRDCTITGYDAHDRGIHLKTLVTDRHKLTIFANESYGELFDLESDPAELHNLFNHPDSQKIQAQLMQRLAHRLIEDEDPLPQRLAWW